MTTVHKNTNPTSGWLIPYHAVKSTNAVVSYSDGRNGRVIESVGRCWDAVLASSTLSSTLSAPPNRPVVARDVLPPGLALQVTDQYGQHPTPTLTTSDASNCVPIVACIVWADDDQEWIDTVAVGWSDGDLVQVRDVRNRLRPPTWRHIEDRRNPSASASGPRPQGPGRPRYRQTVQLGAVLVENPHLNRRPCSVLTRYARMSRTG